MKSKNGLVRIAKNFIIHNKYARPLKVSLKYLIGVFKSAVAKLGHLTGYELRKVDHSQERNALEKDLKMYQRLYPSESIENRSFFNVGAGRFSHPYWTNVDKLSDWYGPLNPNSIDHDLFSLAPISVASDTAELVYTSHTIEHINDEAADYLFSEVYRMLKSGGGFRITCPDIDIEYRAYKDNDRDYFFWIDAYSEPEFCARHKMRMPMNKAPISQIFLAHFAAHTTEIFDVGVEHRISDEEFNKVFREMSYEDALNYCTSKCSLEIQKTNVGNHINWCNKAKIIKCLKKTGFKIVYESAYAQSFFPVLRNTKYFDNTFPQISLYIEAVK